MARTTLSLLLALTTGIAGCAGTPPSNATAPALAGYFDCVRERGVAISAHRAQSLASHPENSIAAIEATGRAIPGAILEMDVARTADGRLVLMHDETLERTSTGTGRVADLAFEQVRAARLTATDGTTTAEPPPTLAEALAAVMGVGAIASLDLKPGDEAATLALARAVIAEVRESAAADHVILITYSAETARAVAALAPDMMLSAGMDDVSGLDGLNPPQILAWTGTRAPRPELWQALNAQGVEPQFGTLGAAGRRLDDVYAADGDVGEYRDLLAQGVVVIATSTPLAVQGELAAELAAAATCPR